MHRFHASLLLAAAAFAAASPARAAFFDGTSGLVSADQTINFDEVALTPNQPVTTEFQAFGVTFDGAFANADLSPYPNIAGNRIGSFQAGLPAHTLTMTFDTALSAVAFSMVTTPGVSTFSALLGGVVVETATHSTSTSDASNFYGFRDIVFDSVFIIAPSFNPALLLDNLQTVAAVPEPESWALMLAGTVLVGALTRRQGAGQ